MSRKWSNCSCNYGKTKNWIGDVNKEAKFVTETFMFGVISTGNVTQ
jgi:hypothetical protein